MAVNFKGFAAVPQIVVGPVLGNPGNILANTVGLLSLTVPGSTPDMHFVVTSSALDVGLAIGGAYCTTAGTVVVRLVNPTVGPINDVETSFYVLGL